MLIYFNSLVNRTFNNKPVATVNAKGKTMAIFFIMMLMATVISVVISSWMFCNALKKNGVKDPGSLATALVALEITLLLFGLALSSFWVTIIKPVAH